MEPSGVLSASASAPARPHPPGCVDVCGPSGWLPWSGCVRRAAADAGAPVTWRDWRSPAGNCVASLRHRDAPGCTGMSREESRCEPGRGVRGTASAADRERPPDTGQRERGAGSGPGGLAVLGGFPGVSLPRPGLARPPWSPSTQPDAPGGRWEEQLAWWAKASRAVAGAWACRMPGPGGGRAGRCDRWTCARGRRGRRHRGGGAREGEAVKPGEASGHGWTVPPRTRQAGTCPAAPVPPGLVPCRTSSD